MSPRDFDHDIVQARLALMRGLLSDLAGIGHITEDRLMRSPVDRHAVERILTQLVQLAVDINSHAGATLLGNGPSDYRESFASAARAGLIDHGLAGRLAPAAGLRNILIHHYVDVDLALVAAAAGEALADFSTYIEKVAAFLLDH